MFVFAVILALAVAKQTAGSETAKVATSVAAERPAPHLDRPYTTRQHIGVWTLTVRRDPFASTTACTIKASRMTFNHGALAMRFGTTSNTFDAVYRIDSGPRIDVRSDILDLARLGLPIYQESLANASGGLVRIPGDRIHGAQQVRVELRRGGRIYARQLNGLDESLAMARQQGCEDLG